MISIDLTGNAGDQITRYLLCRSVAEKNGYKWGINKRTSHDYFNGAEQMSFLDVDYGLPNDTPYGELPEGITNVWEEIKIDYNGCSFHPFQPNVFDIEDNTKLIFYCGHDARYYNRDKVKEWLTIRESNAIEYQKMISGAGIDLDDENLVVINARGGEYRGVPSLLLTPNYWNLAIEKAFERNPNSHFIVITEDPNYYKTIFNCPVHHFSIGCDFYVVQHAKNLLLSNSAFAIFATWTNPNDPYVIAPRYWSRHNVSTGYWANSDMWTFGWNFMDRDGKLYDR